MEENKVVIKPVEPQSDAPKQVKPVVKSPKKQSKVNVKFVRNIDREVALVEAVDSPGDFYLVSPDVFEPGLRHTEIATTERKPHDWSKMLNDALPDRKDMIAAACAHLIKNGMVDVSDLDDNAKRNKAFREMLNYSIPKPENKE